MNFFEMLDLFRGTRNEIEKNELREKLMAVIKEEGYIYLPEDDDFAPEDGVTVFEIMAMGFTDFDDSEAIMKKNIFKIDESIAKAMATCFLTSANSSIKHQAVYALYLGLDQNEKAKKSFDFVFRKLIPDGGEVKESMITKITPPSLYDENQFSRVRKYLGEVTFSLPNGHAYFSIYKVSPFQYSKLMRSDFDSDKYMRCIKGVPDGV